MTHPARGHQANDWHIVRKEVARIGMIIGIGLEEYHFKSPSLHYRAIFYLPKVSVGASIGINISSVLSTALSQTNSQLGDLRSGNNTWEILRRFSMNDLDGGSIKIGSIGATTGPVGGNAAKLKITDKRGIDIASYEGGSFGVELGAEINIGRAAIGTLIGPYNER